MASNLFKSIGIHVKKISNVFVFCFLFVLFDIVAVSFYWTVGRKWNQGKWFKNSIGPSVFTISVCACARARVCVCVRVFLSVSDLYVTVLVVESLAWWILAIIPLKYSLFRMLTFDLLTWSYFQTLFEFFSAIYHLLILEDSVDQTKWHRDLKFYVWDLCLIIDPINMIFIFWKLIPVLRQNSKWLQSRVCRPQFCPWKLCFTIRNSLFKI